ncbi:MAG: TonB-dependent receptor [Tannerella sp.]|jgi:iron complex outermembrane receptor protein|nr:TonB-dependent receptor [Tannerella sp.]
MKRKKFNDNRTVRFKRFVRKAYGAFNSMHKTVNIGVITACTLTFAHFTETSAQTVSVQQTAEGGMTEKELGEVTVTASRTETPLSRTAKIVTVITREDIARAPVQSIQDLLVYAASIDVIQRGGNGVQSDISIRGGSADQTAVLLNGVNLSNSHTGHYSFDIPISLSDVERIEILHGPSALIYGSSAFSGGINIITKKKVDSNIYAKVEAGMYNLLNAEVRGAGDVGKASNSLSFGYQKSDGYIDNSDYGMYNALWQTRLRIDEASRIDFQAGYNNKMYGANTFYSASYPNQYERVSEMIGSISGLFGQKFRFIPQFYWSRHYDRFDLIKDSEQGRNYHRSDLYGTNLMFSYASRIGATHFGGEIRREDISSSNLGKPMAQPHDKYLKYDDRTQTNAVAEHTFSWREFVFSAGVLANYNTLQNDKFRFYPSASVSYKPVNSTKIYATWSRSSRLPTFTDLYYTTETHNANEVLQAERSESFDLALNYKNRYFDFTLTGYMMNGRDMIDWVRESGDNKWASWNHTNVDKRGLEAQIRVPLFDNSSSLTVGYARMYQDCDTKGLESRYTLNYLRDKLTAQLNHKILNNLSASWHFRFQDRMGSYRRYEGGADKGLEEYPAFSTLDLKLSYEYKKFSFKVDINNLYDTYYYDIGNVPQPGFWLLCGVAVKL